MSFLHGQNFINPSNQTLIHKHAFSPNKSATIDI